MFRRRRSTTSTLAEPHQGAAGPTSGPVPGADAEVTTVDEQTVFGPTGRIEQGQRLLLLEQIKSWCGDSRTKITIKPVIDLTAELSTPAYEIPDRIREQIVLRDQTCVFPWCNRPAKRCDKDHNVPFDQGGATCSCNLAPLCRRHHRLKTFTAWRYEPFDDGTYLWTSPFGRQYLRDNTGTIDVTPPDGPPGQRNATHPGTGCYYDRD